MFAFTPQMMTGLFVVNAALCFILGSMRWNKAWAQLTIKPLALIAGVANSILIFWTR